MTGLGPWDVVTGVYSNYAAAATSLNLALAAPSAQAFLIGAVTGDSDCCLAGVRAGRLDGAAHGHRHERVRSHL